MTNEITKGKPTILDILKNQNDHVKRQMQMVLPEHLKKDADKMIRILITEVNKNPALLKCNPSTILSSLISASQLGLEIGGIRQHAYLIPYKDSCQFIVGYRGMIELIYRSPKVLNFKAKAVYENDEFLYEDGIETVLKHKPSQGERGAFIGAYAVVKLHGGSYIVDFMYKNEIDKIRSKSPAKDREPWTQHYEAMAIKTVIRRLFKYIPISVEISNAVALDEAADAGIQHEIIDNSFTNLDGEPTSKSDEIAAIISDKDKDNVDFN